MIEIGDVALAQLDSERLWGHNIEHPKPGEQTNDYVIEIAGWALGRSSPVVAVEVVHEGVVVRRVPITVHRPDLPEAFPQVSGAAQGGFRASVSMTGMTELELLVRAVLGDQSRVPLGSIRARRRWRQDDYGIGAALVSVIIPCHNQAHFLSEAIESVLAQTYPHFEVIVVDDGSTDNTQEVVARYPGVRLVRHDENRGLAEARNAGLRRSNGSHLVFLDADDRLLPEALEAGLECLKQHPECAFVSGRCEHVAGDGFPLPMPQQPARVDGDHYLGLLARNHIAVPATVMYRRAVFESVVGFEPSISPAEDYDLYLRIAKQFPIHCHEKVVAEYRKHGSSVTRDAELMLKSGVEVLRAQRKHVRRSERYKAAYKIGLRRWRDEYGEQLTEEVRARVREREWKQALRGLWVLLRYHPRGFASTLRSSLS